ncbi:MAG TPA: cyclomaltodextrinase N-terminal domain-containing protein, partial [Bacteroidales bacterium]|nr:cyclomaltodextrinase N-terminal domain-containing protein [Bacteroidales bacterium]
MKCDRLVFTVLILASTAVTAFSQKIERVEPPSWFAGMKEPVVQLMVYGKDIGSFDASVSYPGAEVTTVIKTD